MTDPERLSPFRLGDWIVRPSRLVVERDEEIVEVEPKAMELLLVLAERPGESFTRRELLDRVWPEVVVGDEALTRAIYVLRKSLGDASRDPTYIETISKIGYRLLAPVAPVESGEGAVPDRSEGSPGSTSARHLRRAVAGLGTVVATGIAAWVLILQGASPPAPSPTAFRVTSEPGVEWGAAASPGGDRIAYSRAEDPGKADLYVRDLGGPRPLRLTADTLLDHDPTWSPDGRSIAFLRTGPDHCRILVIPALGGPEREIATCTGPTTHPAFHHLSWSPDGRWIAWSEGRGSTREAEVRLIDVRSGSARSLEIVDPDGRAVSALRPTFSPDGAALAFHAITNEATSLRVVPFADGRVTGPARLVAADVNNVHGLSWGPGGREIFFSSDRGGRSTLYHVSADGGEMVRMDVGAEAIRPFVVPGRGLLVYEEWIYDFDLHAIPLDARDPARLDEPIVDSTQWDGYPSISPDGRRLAFASSRTGWTELFLTDSRGGGEDVPLTALRAQGLSPPRWSPDGSRIVFGAQIDREAGGSGGADLYVLDEIGATPRRLTTWPGHETSPSWSRDGKWILFGSDRDGSWQVWRVPVGGGEPERVTTDGGYVARETSGGHLVYTKRGEDGLWTRPEPPGGAERLVTSDFPSDDRNWIVREDVAYRLGRSEEGIPQLVATDLSTGAVTVVRELPEGDVARNASFDLGPDRSRLYLARMSTVGSDLQAIPLPAPSTGMGRLAEVFR